MRKLLTLLAVFTCLTAATVSHAANGTVDLSWGTVCTPVVSDITPTAGDASLMISEIGNDQTHNAYQVYFILGSASKSVPDAWRFDAAGCQGSSLITINHLPPAAASKSCPAFQGASASIQIKDFSFLSPTSGYASTMMRGTLANTYPATFTSVGGTRYFLAQFIFNHLFSVTGAGDPPNTCGGLETPMCIALLQGPAAGSPGAVEAGTTSYLLAPSGVEVPFDRGANNFATVNGLGGCPTVPVQATTWGQIKSQYRN